MAKLFSDYEKNLDEIIGTGREVVKNTNTNEKFTGMWRDTFSRAKYIGHTNVLLCKYSVMSTGGSFEDKVKHYITSYLNDPDPDFDEDSCIGSRDFGRGIPQLREIAKLISYTCSEGKIVFEDGMQNDVERLMCLILYHVSYETIIGKMGELLIENYFNKFGLTRDNKTEIDDCVWDSNGTDIILYKDGKIFRFVQVKPISYMLGEQPDLIADRSECFKTYQPFVNEYVKKHPEELHKDIKTDIIYCFYDKDKKNGEYRFVNFKNRTDDNGIFIKKEGFTEKDGNRKYTFRDIKDLPRVNV